MATDTNPPSASASITLTNPNPTEPQLTPEQIAVLQAENRLLREQAAHLGLPRGLDPRVGRKPEPFRGTKEDKDSRKSNNGLVAWIHIGVSLVSNPTTTRSISCVNSLPIRRVETMTRRSTALELSPVTSFLKLGSRNTTPRSTQSTPIVITSLGVTRGTVNPLTTIFSVTGPRRMLSMFHSRTPISFTSLSPTSVPPIVRKSVPTKTLLSIRISPSTTFSANSNGPTQL